MNLLLDTHALLWFVSGDPRLSRKVRKAIEHSENVSYISMASWWEMAIKCSLGKLKLDDSLDIFFEQRLEEGFRILPIEAKHIISLVNLPFHHRDPFDRLILCQAMTESLPIYSGDPNFSKYKVRVLW